MRVKERVMFRERLSLFLKMRLSYYLSAKVGKGGGDEICGGFKKVNFVIFVEFEKKYLTFLSACVDIIKNSLTSIFLFFSCQ